MVLTDSPIKHNHNLAWSLTLKWQPILTYIKMNSSNLCKPQQKSQSKDNHILEVLTVNKFLQQAAKKSAVHHSITCYNPDTSKMKNQTGSRTSWDMQVNHFFLRFDIWFLKECWGSRNSSVGSAWARCPQRCVFDPPLGTFSGRGDFSLGVYMGSNSIPQTTLSDESINRGLVCAHMHFIARTQKILTFMS